MTPRQLQRAIDALPRAVPPEPQITDAVDRWFGGRIAPARWCTNDTSTATGPASGRWVEIRMMLHLSETICLAAHIRSYSN
jgi:hypothetical protein